MKTALARAVVAGALLLAPAAAFAQETDVKQYALDVRLEPAAQAASVRTTMTVWNPTDAPKRQLQFRVTAKAEIQSVTVAGQPAQFVAEPDRRFPGLQSVRVTLAAPIAGGGTADVVVATRLALDTALPDAVIGPGRTALLPSSYWFPAVNTAFTQYGVNTAPVTMSVAGGETAVAGGEAAGGAAPGADARFTQRLYDLPFLITGAFAPESARATPAGLQLAADVPAGAPEDLKAGASRLLAEAEKIVAFYAAALGPAPKATFRIVASESAAGFVSPSAAVFAPRVFLRRTTDAETFELLADALARAWIGQAAVRGVQPGGPPQAAGRPAPKVQGVAILQDALPRYLAILAMGSRFGEAAERAAFDRARVDLLRMGATGASMHLSAASPFDPAYRGIVSTRGPLALRVVEREAGRDAMLAGIRAALASARTSGWITAESLRAAVQQAAGRDLTPVFGQWLESVIEPDVIVGVPVRSGSGWTSAVRNLGSGDVTVDIVATTASGKRVPARVSVPAEDFAEATFETAEQVASVEVDPDHVIIQTDYSNDARPPRPEPADVYAEALRLFQQKDYPAAEAKLRPLGTGAQAGALLSRALLAEGKTTEAAAAATAVVAAEPAPVGALAWAHVVLGTAAASSGRHAEAAELFRLAYAEAADAPALLASREGLVAAERAAGRAPALDDSVRAFFADFDRAVSAGVNTSQASQFIDAAALPEFVRGLVTSASRRWATEVLRAEAVAPDELLVDARFTVTPSSGAPSTAPAIVRLRRAGAGWRVVAVQLLGG